MTTLKSAAHGDTAGRIPGAPVAFHDTAALFHRVPRAHRQRPRAHVHRAGGPGAPAATDLEPGRGREQPFLVPDLRLSRRQDDLGARRYRTAQYNRPSRTAGWWPPENPTGRTPSRGRQDPQRDYLVSLIVAPLVRSQTMARRAVDYYVYRGDSSRARRLFDVTPDMIEVYSRPDRRPLPLGQVCPDHRADFFGGMENVSATTLVDGSPTSAPP